MPSIGYYQVGERIVSVLPELAEAFETCLAEWQPRLPGAVNVADEVLTPALDRWLDAGSDEDVLRRAFQIIEELAADDDSDVRDAIQVGVVNWIAQDLQWVRVAKRFIGPSTREMLERSGLVSGTRDRRDRRPPSR